MANFTHCKWYYTLDGNGLGFSVFPYGSDDSGKRIAHVYLGKSPEKYMESFANARLIAQAPAMYWMMRNMLCEFERGNASDPEYIKQCTGDIRDVLAKIDGIKPDSSQLDTIMRSLLKECLSVLTGISVAGREHVMTNIELIERLNDFLSATANTER